MTKNDPMYSTKASDIDNWFADYAGITAWHNPLKYKASLG